MNQKMWLMSMTVLIDNILQFITQKVKNWNWWKNNQLMTWKLEYSAKSLENLAEMLSRVQSSLRSTIVYIFIFWYILRSTILYTRLCNMNMNIFSYFYTYLPSFLKSASWKTLWLKSLKHLWKPNKCVLKTIKYFCKTNCIS